MPSQYDQKYAGSAFYWGRKPSPFCLRALELMPVDRPLRLIDIGCGEGRNAVFFARNGFEVTAFDLAESGVAKTRQLAKDAGVAIRAFQADLLEHRLDGMYDVVFCHGCLHYIPPQLRQTILADYRDHTSPGGLNALSAFVRKPFIPKAPDFEGTSHPWLSGELFTHYSDWRLEVCTELIFDCNSSGVPHQHAMDQMIARKME